MSDNIKKIPIKNIFYMLCYAGDLLEITKDKNVGIDDYDADIFNLLSRVFSFSLNRVIKGGFHHSYISKSDELYALRGKIDIKKSFNSIFSKKNKLVCEFDEFSKNNLFNNILKFTINRILHSSYIDNNIKQKIKPQSVFFEDVDELPPTNDVLRKLTYNKSNTNYRLLILISKMIYNNIVINEDNGDYIFKDFYREEHMHSVFEHFLLNFYKVNLDKKVYNVHAPKIKWQIDDTIVNSHSGDFNIIVDISDRRTDIVIENKDINLQMIIDAKYYKKTLTEAYMNSDKERPWVNNIYQIRGYILDSEFIGGKIGGLVYPTVDKSFNQWYPIKNASINIQTINLNQDWRDIEQDLFRIIDNIESFYLKLI